MLKTLHDDLDVYAELFRESGLLDEGDTFGRALQGVPSPSAMGAKVGARVDAKVGADAKVDAQADAKADADVGAHAHADTHNDDDVRQLLRAVEDVGSLLLQDVVDFYKSVVNAEHHLDTDEVKLEITPGVGGLEAKLFCSDLLSMYEHFCKLKDFQCTLIRGESDDAKDGHRNIVAVVKGERVYEHFVQENGIHRVQRVPVNSKKIQTSTSVVFVYDEESLRKKIKKKMNLKKSDLIIETKRSGGPGGQSVNKNETCVKVLHKPTNISVEVQKTSSQMQNRNMAIEALKTKLFSFYYQQEKDLFFKCRRSHKMSGDRSEKIRSYNFINDFVTDHLSNVQYPGIDLFFRGDGLLRLVDHHRRVFYRHLVDETLRFILARTQE